MKDSVWDRMFETLATGQVPSSSFNALVPVQSIGGDMQFTIIRPGGLKTQPATGRGVLTEDVNVCGAIHREDVADLLVHALFSDKAANKVRPPYNLLVL